MEGRLRDARRHLGTGAKRLEQSGRTYGNEQEIIEILQLAINFENGIFNHIPAEAPRLRNSLVKSDSWVELFEQLARIAVKSTYFASGRGAALAVLEDFRAGYAERHGGSSEVLAVLEATIARMDGGGDTRRGTKGDIADLQYGQPITGAHRFTGSINQYGFIQNTVANFL